MVADAWGKTLNNLDNLSLTSTLVVSSVSRRISDIVATLRDIALSGCRERVKTSVNAATTIAPDRVFTAASAMAAISAGGRADRGS